MEITANQIYVSTMDNMVPLVILAVVGKYVMFKACKTRQHPRVYTKSQFKTDVLKHCKYQLKNGNH